MHSIRIRQLHKQYCHAAVRTKWFTPAFGPSLVGLEWFSSGVFMVKTGW